MYAHMHTYTHYSVFLYTAQYSCTSFGFLRAGIWLSHLYPHYTLCPSLISRPFAQWVWYKASHVLACKELCVMRLMTITYCGNSVYTCSTRVEDVLWCAHDVHVSCSPYNCTQHAAPAQPAQQCSVLCWHVQCTLCSVYCGSVVGHVASYRGCVEYYGDRLLCYGLSSLLLSQSPLLSACSLGYCVQVHIVCVFPRCPQDCLVLLAFWTHTHVQFP